MLPGSRGSGLSRGQLLACALVALLVVSGAVLLLTRDAPAGEPVPQTGSRPALVTAAGSACAEVTERGYTWARLVVVSERLRALTPPAADAASWSTAVRALDAAVAVEKRAVDARTDAAALRRLAPERVKARAAATAAFDELGVACPG